MRSIISTLQRAEQRLGKRYFATEAPLGGAYIGSQYWPLLYTIERLNMPSDWSFADLGSGLGNIAFPAATHFKAVVGFELDTALFHEAERCRQELGFANIQFRQDDFLYADLSDFNVIFFFKPFVLRFVELMHHKMQELRPGTRVIANTINYERARIFDPRSFEQIFEIDDQLALRSDAERYATYLKVDS
ncbi:MAG: methyltransferase domain-containing protein [Candidatus Saganbacteria bacterium]|nr:methyltransferase domain-containing protein [Candidatus Saganbacteria bacterium]